MMNLIDRIVEAINLAEINNDPYSLMEARRLLNADLREKIGDLERRLVDCRENQGVVMNFQLGRLDDVQWAFDQLVEETDGEDQEREGDSND